MPQHEFDDLFGAQPAMPDDLLQVMRDRMQRGLVSDITIVGEMIAELTRYHQLAIQQRDRSLADWARMDAGDVIPLDETIAKWRRESESD